MSKLGKNFLKLFKGAGVLGGIYTTRESYLKVYSQFQEGGLSEVLKNRDILDATVGTVTTGVQGAAFIGFSVNPIIFIWSRHFVYRIWNL